MLIIFSLKILQLFLKLLKNYECRLHLSILFRTLIQKKCKELKKKNRIIRSQKRIKKMSKMTNEG